MRRKRQAPRPGMAVDVELLSERQLRAKKGRRDNLFAWTVFLLLLVGVVFACWMGSFYVFQHPENARSYKLLRKLKKVDPPRRFEPTLAPNGKFHSAKDLVKMYADKTDADLTKINLELLQAYIGNYSIREYQVPYLMGHFSVIESRALTDKDLITSGYVALARSVEEPRLLIEQLYPSERENEGELREMLQPGVEIKLERTYDLSAVLHVERLPEDTWQVTIVPLNYDKYGLGNGREVHLSPPFLPNLAAAMPFIDTPLTGLENSGPAAKKTAKEDVAKSKPTPVLARTGPTPDQSVIRVARAIPLTGLPPPVPKTSPTATPQAIALASPTPSPTAGSETIAASVPTISPSPTTTPKAVIASSAAPTPKKAARWETFRPGQMPRGRLFDVPDLETLAQNGGPGGTAYLQGSFLVKANDGNRALLRTSSRMASALGLGKAAQGQTRVIVEYPEGQTAPKVGSQVERDSIRPFQIMSVRRDAKGQINVFVREVTAP